MPHGVFVSHFPQDNRSLMRFAQRWKAIGIRC
jgi:hypothetical protein